MTEEKLTRKQIPSMATNVHLSGQEAPRPLPGLGPRFTMTDGMLHLVLTLMRPGALIRRLLRRLYFPLWVAIEVITGSKQSLDRIACQQNQPWRRLAGRGTSGWRIPSELSDACSIVRNSRAGKNATSGVNA